MIRLTALLLVPLLAACAGAGAGPSDEVSPEIVVPSEVAMPSLGDVSLPAGMIDDVIALAEAETGVARDEIEIVVAEAVTWSDGAIGCPEEGMMYTQALVPGYRVILDVAGQELAFHASETGEFSACANPIEPIEGSPDS